MSGMAADGLMKVLMFNKFLEFVELVGVLKIKASDSKDSKASESEDSKASDGEDDSNSDSDSDENDEIFENSTDKEIKIGKNYYEKEAE